MGNGIKSKWHPRKLYFLFFFLCFFENPPLETNDCTNKNIYIYIPKGDYSNKSTLSKKDGEKEVQNNGIKINSERGSILMILILLKLAVLMVKRWCEKMKQQQQHPKMLSSFNNKKKAKWKW